MNDSDRGKKLGFLRFRIKTLKNTMMTSVICTTNFPKDEGKTFYGQTGQSFLLRTKFPKENFPNNNRTNLPEDEQDRLS